ncbi:hypothetical protein QCA50_002717 [Cerrena zonata]|uniref:Cyclic-AMP phosphodiesterase n=1 Tax=Cerrena zonata TaxID=2478898 RepID=A0AAW0GUL3_9APHY
MTPVFDLVVLGCGGGPSEYNLSSYLLKSCAASWTEGIVALEAGNGIGALHQILKENPEPFFKRPLDGDRSFSTASRIYSCIQCYLITHAHLDHVNSLVLAAGSLSGPPRRVFGLTQTLKDLETIFADRLWPNLASWDADDPEVKLLYSKLNADGQYKAISSHLSARTMTVSHGRCRAGDPYDSATFFIRHDPSGHELLFFGDVEPDTVADQPRNRDVWRIAASKIPDQLRAIFIECSWPSGRPDSMLYGHLTPEHLRDELVILATEVLKARQEKTLIPADEPVRKRTKMNPPSPGSLTGVLEGLRVYIMHCKEDINGSYDQPIQLVIAGQIRNLVNDLKLGVEIVAVEQGMHITI